MRVEFLHTGDTRWPKNWSQRKRLDKENEREKRKRKRVCVPLSYPLHIMHRNRRKSVLQTTAFMLPLVIDFSFGVCLPFTSEIQTCGEFLCLNVTKDAQCIGVFTPSQERPKPKVNFDVISTSQVVLTNHLSHVLLSPAHKYLFSNGAP